MFRQRAMEIIHWIAHVTRKMPLFDDHDVNTNYGQDDGDRLEVLGTTVVQRNLLPTINLPALRCVDENVLPHRAIVRAHLEVYDATVDDSNPPYRLTGFRELDSEEYHRSVYLNLQDVSKTIDVDAGVDVERLFRTRREQSWKGTDSLYHAWLLINHRRTHALFGMKKFAARHPDWRAVMMKSLDLTPSWDDSSQKQTGNLPPFIWCMIIRRLIRLCSRAMTNHCPIGLT